MAASRIRGRGSVLVGLRGGIKVKDEVLVSQAVFYGRILSGVEGKKLCEISAMAFFFLSFPLNFGKSVEL